jgi:hypothetical protein
MYTVGQVIELVSYAASDWSPERLLLVIKEVHKEILRGNVQAVEYRDPLTGLPYALDTTDGLFYYEMPDMCRKVKDVLSRIRQSGLSYRPANCGGEAWESVINVKSSPKVQGVNASITFPANPGTTTGLYYVPFWLDISDIENINSTIYVPSEYQGLMIDGIIARIQSYQFGKPDAYVEWKERMKMEVWNELNYNPPEIKFTPARPC